MVKLVPVAILEPPVAAVYQLIVPTLVVAPSVTVPAPVLAPEIPVTTGVAFTVATTAVLVAVVQPVFVAST